MKTVRYVVVMLIVGILFGGVVLAQEQTQLPIVCTQDDYLWLQGRLNELSAQFADVATYDPVNTASEMRALIESMQFVCNGMFTKETHPEGIVGPIVFDGSIYEIQFVTRQTENTAGGVLEIITVSGDCGNEALMLTSYTTPMVVDVFEFDNCVAMFDINAGDWDLLFAKIQ